MHISIKDLNFSYCLIADSRRYVAPPIPTARHKQSCVSSSDEGSDDEKTSK